MNDEDDMDLQIDDLVMLVRAVQGNIKRVAEAEEDAITRAYLECSEQVLSEGVTYLASAMMAKGQQVKDDRQLELFT